jgi:hypothetical protein
MMVDMFNRSYLNSDISLVRIILDSIVCYSRHENKYFTYCIREGLSMTISNA